MTIGEKDGYLTVVSERNEANSVGEDFNMMALTVENNQYGQYLKTELSVPESLIIGRLDSSRESFLTR